MFNILTFIEVLEVLAAMDTFLSASSEAGFMDLVWVIGTDVRDNVSG